MSRIKSVFQEGKYFHVYQKTENGKQLFISEEDKEIFLCSIQKVITPYADIIGFCVLTDHYHLLIKVKKDKFKRYGFPNVSQMLTLNLRRFIRNYNFWLNREYNTKGKILKALPHAVQVKDKDKLKSILTGIHLNPLYHNISQHPIEYEWSSYKHILNMTNNNIKVEEAISYYGDKSDFVNYHLFPITWGSAYEP